jgi:hypothetical protein
VFHNSLDVLVDIPANLPAGRQGRESNLTWLGCLPAGRQGRLRSSGMTNKTMTSVNTIMRLLIKLDSSSWSNILRYGTVLFSTADN